MAIDRERRLSLLATIDEPAARRAAQRIAELRREFEQTTAAAKNLSLGNDGVNTSLDKLGSVRGALTNRFASVRGQGQNLLGEAQDVAAIAQTTKASTQLRGAMQDLPPAILQTVNAMQGPGGMAAAVTGLAPSIASVGAAGLIAAPAIIALGIAITKFMEKVKDSKRFLQDALDAQRLYAEAVAGGTRETIQAQLAELRVKQQARQIERQLLEQQIEDLNILQKLFAGGQLKKQLRDTSAAISETDNAIARLGDALTDSRVVARSDAQDQAAAAAEEAKKAKAVQATTGKTQDAIRAEQDRASAIEATVSAMDLARQKILDERAFRAETDKLVADAQQKRAEGIADLLKRAAEAGQKAMRQVDYSIQRILDRLAFDVPEMGFDRNFAGIAAARRQAQFDIATTRQDARFDQMERNIDLQTALSDERVRQEKQINDLVAERAKILVEATVEMTRQILAAAGLWVPGGGAIDLRNNTGGGLSPVQQRQVNNMIGAGLEGLLG